MFFFGGIFSLVAQIRRKAHRKQPSPRVGCENTHGVQSFVEVSPQPPEQLVENLFEIASIKPRFLGSGFYLSRF